MTFRRTWVLPIAGLAVLTVLVACGGGGGDSSSPSASSSSSTTSSASSQSSSPTVINGIVVPPDPGEAGKATLAGVDSDNDGVRDDIQRWIVSAHPNSAKVRLGLSQLGVQIQAGILSTTREQSRLAAEQSDKAIRCLDHVGGATTDNSQRSLEALFVNTPERLRAWSANEARLSGMGFMVALPAANDCTFNVQSLPN